MCPWKSVGWVGSKGLRKFDTVTTSTVIVAKCLNLVTGFHMICRCLCHFLAALAVKVFFSVKYPVLVEACLFFYLFLF